MAEICSDGAGQTSKKNLNNDLSSVQKSVRFENDNDLIGNFNEQVMNLEQDMKNSSPSFKIKIQERNSLAMPKMGELAP